MHDLHIWAMSTTETALTAHLVRRVPTCDAAFLETACRQLREEFQIQHATIQLEPEDHVCDLASEKTV